MTIPLLPGPLGGATLLLPGLIPAELQRVSNQNLGFDTPRANLLRNAGFEDWPNGPGPFTVEGQESASGWTVYPNRFGEIAIIRQAASTAPSGSISAARVIGTTTNANLIAQEIDPSVCALNNVTVSLSYMILAPVGAQVQCAVGIVEDVAYQLPETVVGTGDWQTVRMTCTLPPAPARAIVVALGGFGFYDFLFDNASLVVGAAPADYVPTVETTGTVGPPGPAGPQGPPGPAAVSYQHEQLMPEATWSIQHGLARYPSVTVVDTGNSVIIPDVHYDDPYSLTLSFGSPTSGKAYLN